MSCKECYTQELGALQTRKNCIHCVEKHMGTAAVLFVEMRKDPYLIGQREEETPTVIHDVEAHLGAAAVLFSEMREGYPYRLLAIGHLSSAEDAITIVGLPLSLALSDAIRSARETFQLSAVVPDFKRLEAFAGRCRTGSSLFWKRREDSPPRRLLAIGHLHEAQEESQGWPLLSDVIRTARRQYQYNDVVPDFAALQGLAEYVRTGNQAAVILMAASST